MAHTQQLELHTWLLVMDHRPGALAHIGDFSPSLSLRLLRNSTGVWEHTGSKEAIGGNSIIHTGRCSSWLHWVMKWKEIELSRAHETLVGQILALLNFAPLNRNVESKRVLFSLS